MNQDLYKTALLGTDRMTPSVETLETLHALGIETEDLTEAVLLGIGMLTRAQKAAPILIPIENESPNHIKA